MKKKDEIKVCLVGSSGGHLTHLYMLKPFWKDKDHFWVTFDKEDFHAQTLILCNEIFFQLLIQLRLSAFLRSTSGTSSTAPLHQKSFFAFF